MIVRSDQLTEKVAGHNLLVWGPAMAGGPYDGEKSLVSFVSA